MEERYTIEDIKKNGMLLKYIINPSPYEVGVPSARYNALCKLAVQQNGYALEYVINQTDEICKLAVRYETSFHTSPSIASD
jgi:hypothetical protein